MGLEGLSKDEIIKEGRKMLYELSKIIDRKTRTIQIIEYLVPSNKYGKRLVHHITFTNISDQGNEPQIASKEV